MGKRKKKRRKKRKRRESEKDKQNKHNKQNGNNKKLLVGVFLVGIIIGGITGIFVGLSMNLYEDFNQTSSMEPAAAIHFESSSSERVTVTVSSAGTAESLEIKHNGELTSIRAETGANKTVEHGGDVVRVRGTSESGVEAVLDTYNPAIHD